MIYDLRTYTLVDGRLGTYLDMYEKEGLPIQRRHLGDPVGYFTTKIGESDAVVHLWRYETLADREERRAAMDRDPEWIAYRAKGAAAGHVQQRENRILSSVRFSKL